MKEQVQMLEIKIVDININILYNIYQTIFLNIALGHIKFNYLKTILQIFYLDRLAS